METSNSKRENAVTFSSVNRSDVGSRSEMIQKKKKPHMRFARYNENQNDNKNC